MSERKGSINSILDAINSSDVKQASDLFLDRITKGENALKIHDSLFPTVQRVLNPPFIAPHLPKMYCICRQLFQYLEKDEVANLVRLEIQEYARRAKMIPMPRQQPSAPLGLKDIKFALQERDANNTAELFASAYASMGKTEFARQLLLIGSGYLEDSLGHSISCTAFILQEMMDQPGQDPWPALSALADYFCKGRFSETPDLVTKKPSRLEVEECLLRAVSGSSIVDLHNTITLYAIENTRHLLAPGEYEHMLASWIEYVGDKSVELFPIDRKFGIPENYSQFYQIFSDLDASETVNYLAGLLDTDLERCQIGQFIIRGLCQHYKGEYNPHFITGLGEVMWLIGRYWSQPSIALTGLHQYISFFYEHAP